MMSSFNSGLRPLANFQQLGQAIVTSLSLFLHLENEVIYFWGVYGSVRTQK